MSVAEDLKKIADSTHTTKNDKEVTDLYNFLIKQSKKDASEGSYSTEVYDDRLLNSDIAKALKVKLREDGFRVVIEVDHHYTEHSGSTQMYVRINWD